MDYASSVDVTDCTDQLFGNVGTVFLRKEFLFLNSWEKFSAVAQFSYVEITFLVLKELI